MALVQEKKGFGVPIVGKVELGIGKGPLCTKAERLEVRRWLMDREYS